MLYFLKNILQLILAPHKAWGDIAEDNRQPSWLQERGLYPLMAVMAITAFVHWFYGSEPFSVAKALESALCQFISLFAGVMVGRAVFEGVLPSLSSQQVPLARTATVPIYCIGVLALFQIVTNLCPIWLTLFWFLPALIIIIAWQARGYLNIAGDKVLAYIFTATATLVVLPLLCMFLFSLLLGLGF